MRENLSARQEHFKNQIVISLLSLYKLRPPDTDTANICSLRHMCVLDDQSGLGSYQAVCSCPGVSQITGNTQSYNLLHLRSDGILFYYSMLVWWATCLIWDTPVVLHPVAILQHPLLFTEAHTKHLQKAEYVLEGIKAILTKKSHRLNRIAPQTTKQTTQNQVVHWKGVQKTKNINRLPPPTQVNYPYSRNSSKKKSILLHGHSGVRAACKRLEGHECMPFHRWRNSFSEK